MNHRTVVQSKSPTVWPGIFALDFSGRRSDAHSIGHSVECNSKFYHAYK